MTSFRRTEDQDLHLHLPDVRIVCGVETTGLRHVGEGEGMR